MKPSFALDFRDGAIALLHRTSRGWQQVGSTPIDAPDLGEALTYLRSTALGLSPRGLSTKLVIPNEQVLYTQVHAPGPEVAKRKRQIKAALEGLTPYPVDDLVFDWWGSGPEVQVAVVARDTLAEAEAFAAEHRFNPVSFVAAPDNASFMGEPFFGPSALSASLLADGEKVERDQDPIAVMAREFPRSDPAPEPQAEAAVAPSEPDVPPAPVAAPPEPVAVTAPEPVPVAEPAPAEPVRVEPVSAERQSAEPLSAEPDPLPDFRAAKLPAEGAKPFDPKAMAIDLVDEAPMAVDVQDDRKEVEAPQMPAEPPVTKARAPVDPVVDDLPPSPAQSVVAAFASRRQSAAEAAPPPGRVDDTTAGPDLAPAEPNTTEFAAAKAKKAPPVGPAPAQRPTVPRPTLAKPAAPLPTGGRETVPFPVKAAAAKLAPGKGVKPSVTAPGIAGPRRERNVVPLPKAAAAAVGADDVPTTGQNPRPAKGLTGLDGRPLPVRGKPRYLGLILTAILLIALALVAAWSSFYLSSNDVDPNAVPVTNSVAETAPEADPNAAADPAAGDMALADEPLPSVEDEALADGQDPALAADVGPSDSAAEPATAAETTAAEAPAPEVTSPEVSATPATEVASDAPASDTPAADVVPETPATDTTVSAANAPEATVAEPEVAAVAEPTPAPAEPEVAAVEAAKPEPAPETAVASDAVVAAAPGNEPQDEIFLAAADTPPQTSDPLTLPPVVANTDPPPDAALPPPPFGTVYTFDADGRIQPTPEGILTPEGVLLVAGKPKVVPPVRPAALVAAAPETPAPGTPAPGALASETPAAEGAAPAADAAAAPEPVFSDPALAGKKPRGRPAGLVDPAATAERQGEVAPDLAPDPDSRFASLRPLKRPAALTTQTAEIEEPANDASAASLALGGVQASQSSPLAVLVSKKPAARPSGTDQAVDAAVAAAVSAPEPEPQAEPQTQVAANIAPEAEPEPEPEAEAPAPRVPTSASVAKQATQKDALNLSRVALIGIFGTASGRYAMIRQAGGGIKKVVVGDTIDGGRIAAITATAIQYKKGGKMVTLALPTG